ncbi:hypothetical protein TSUD_18790 [Trifolium subterraneum]|uniref:Uncharacterized protein n=1 Tax=Trifolium subterraneum TaxID=3900 RepID=A0A2Z6NFN1_TRISU|nr:hypothetical protein TSUD_18790 [Trifolium subterraneum]
MMEFKSKVQFQRQSKQPRKSFIANKKRKFISIDVVVKKVKVESQQQQQREEKIDVQIAPCKTVTNLFVNDPQVKKTLSSWRQMIKRNCDQVDPREMARRNIEKITNTARLDENIGLMDDFYKLIDHTQQNDII